MASNGIAACTVAGNITRDAELNESGKVLKFAVAVNKYEKLSADSDREDVAHFFDIKVLGNRASALAPYLTKGTKVTVQGDLVQERWETDGQKRSAVRVLAREVVLGSSPASDITESSSAAGEPDGAPF